MVVSCQNTMTVTSLIDEPASGAAILFLKARGISLHVLDFGDPIAGEPISNFISAASGHKRSIAIDGGRAPLSLAYLLLRIDWH